MNWQIEANEWLDNGRPNDPVVGIPHAAKAWYLTTLAQRHGLDTLVETGTGVGGMLELVQPLFRRYLSTELHEPSFVSSSTAFGGLSGVQLWNGASEATLPTMLAVAGGPALIFLDAHYSGPGTARGESDTPVYQELLTISRWSHSDASVIVVDDARCFGTEADYPTLDELLDFMADHFPLHRVILDTDEVIAEPFA